MTKKEIIKHLHEALDFVDFHFPYRYVFVEAIEALSQPSPPSNLDEAAEKYADDTWLTGENWGDAARRTFNAGSEWMAGKFQKIEGDLVDWYSTSDGKEYCCGIKTDEAFEIPEGFYIRKKQQPGESLKENEDGNK